MGWFSAVLKCLHKHPEDGILVMWNMRERKAMFLNTIRVWCSAVGGIVNVVISLNV